MGVIGNLVNGIFGGGTDGPGQYDPNVNPDASKYGYDTHNQLYSNFTNQANDVNNRQGPAPGTSGIVQTAQIDQSNANRGLLASAAGLQGAAGIGNQQQGLANNLQATINGTAGPSVAQLTAQQQGQQALRNNLAMASAGTGANHAGALINAANQNAMQQGQNVQNAGILRAQEVQAAQGQLGNVLGNMRGQAGAEAGQYTQNAALAGNLASQQAGLQQQTNLANQQGQQFNANLSAQQYNQQQARNDAQNQFYNTQAFNALQGDAAQRAHAEDLRVQAMLGQKGYGIQQQQANNQLTGSVLGSIGGALGSMAVLSDIRTKENIQPMRLDDTYARLGSYGYDYRNPDQMGASDGRHFGPMAQELERTPAGRSVVGQGPNGKSIDAGRLTMLNASHQGELERRLRGIEAALGKPTEYPAIAGNDYRAVVPGNIDLSHRPYVDNGDGSYSTVRSMGANIDGREVLIPTVNDRGYVMGDNEAIDQYRRTGRHMGIYRNARESDAAGQAIHEDQMRNPPEDTLFGLGHPMGARKQIAPTDLIFSADHGGTFRTPEEQYGYVQGLKNDQALADFRRSHSDESTKTVPTLDDFRRAHLDESTRPSLAQRGFNESTAEYDLERNPYAQMEANPYQKGAQAASPPDTKKKAALASLISQNMAQMGNMGGNSRAQLIPIQMPQAINFQPMGRYGY